MFKIIFIWFLSGVVITSIVIDNNKQLFIDNTTNYYDCYISGSVNKPNKYFIYKHDRIIDVIDKAGGLSIYSNIKSVNIYRQVSKGENIFIPFIDGYETKHYLLSATVNDFLKFGISINNSKLIFKYINTYLIKNFDDLLSINGVGIVTIVKLKKWFYL